MANRLEMRMDEGTLEILDYARAKHGMNRSDFIRYAIRNQASGDGTLPRHADGTVIPVMTMKKYLVHFRSADGTLNREYMTAAAKSDLNKIYSDITEIEEVA